LLSLRMIAIGQCAFVANAAAGEPSRVKEWAGYAAANLLVATTYAMIGFIIGPLLGKVAGVFVAFLIPFLDLGIIQNQMLRPEPPAWARFLPGYGSTKVLFDTGLTATFDQTAPLLIGLAWFAGVFVLAAITLAHGGKST
jgi:hypothetical protein